MSSELIAAGSALAGALIGALSGLVAAFLTDRRASRRERRLNFLGSFATAITSDERAREMISNKIMMTTAADRERLVELGGAGHEDAVVDALAGVLLDAVNEERAFQGRPAITLDELTGVIPMGNRRGRWAARPS